MAYFNQPNAATIGSINTAYTVGAIFGGFFVGGPVADYLGRKIGMATGCVLVIAATFMQTFAPRHSLACFLAGRCIIGIGQGIALSKFVFFLTNGNCCLFMNWRLTLASHSRRSHLHRGAGSARDPGQDHDVLADVLLCWIFHLLLDQLRLHQER